jgi:hypothetical protein
MARQDMDELGFRRQDLASAASNAESDTAAATAAAGKTKAPSR